LTRSYTIRELYANGELTQPRHRNIRSTED